MSHKGEITFEEYDLVASGGRLVFDKGVFLFFLACCDREGAGGS